MKRHESPPTNQEALKKLSVIIPARNEEDCIASIVEHLDVELRLHGIDNEIVVVDDGSTDNTWKVLMDVSSRVPSLRAADRPRPERLPVLPPPPARTG